MENDASSQQTAHGQGSTVRAEHCHSGTLLLHSRYILLTGQCIYTLSSSSTLVAELTEGWLLARINQHIRSG